MLVLVLVVRIISPKIRTIHVFEFIYQCVVIIKY